MELSVAFEDSIYAVVDKKYMTKCVCFGDNNPKPIGHEFLHEYSEDDEKLKNILTFSKNQNRKNITLRIYINWNSKLSFMKGLKKNLRTKMSGLNTWQVPKNCLLQPNQNNQKETKKVILLMKVMI